MKFARFAKIRPLPRTRATRKDAVDLLAGSSWWIPEAQVHSESSSDEDEVNIEEQQKSEDSEENVSGAPHGGYHRSPRGYKGSYPSLGPRSGDVRGGAGSYTVRGPEGWWRTDPSASFCALEPWPGAPGVCARPECSCEHAPLRQARCYAKTLRAPGGADPARWLGQERRETDEVG